MRKSQINQDVVALTQFHEYFISVSFNCTKQTFTNLVYLDIYLNGVQIKYVIICEKSKDVVIKCPILSLFSSKLFSLCK